MSRAIAIIVSLCYGVDFDTDTIGRGEATQRTQGYAEQEAICNAKDDAKRQCMERKDKPFFVFASLVSNDCKTLGLREVRCVATVCGSCQETEP